MQPEKIEIRDRRGGDWFWCQNSMLRAKIPHTVKLTYLVLCSYSNKRTETCYPSATRLSKDAGISKRAVIYAVNILEKSGAIKIKSKPGRVNEYSLVNLTSAKIALVQREAQNQCNWKHKTSEPTEPEQTELTKRKNNYASVKGLEHLRAKMKELTQRRSMV